MHPVAPDLGQNECAALEDAVVLAQQIGVLGKGEFMAGEEVSRAFRRYADQRWWGTAGFVALCSSVLICRARWVWIMVNGVLKKVGLDRVFYMCVLGVMHYDCGKLPCVSLISELENEK